MGFAEGDVLFFGADQWENVCEVLGRVRLRCADLLKLTAGRDDAELPLGRRFPAARLFSPEDNRWVAVHHPFTRPKAEDVPLLEAGELRQSARRRLRRGAERRRARRRLDPNPRARAAGARCSRCSASARRSSSSSSATCCAPSPSARRRTAASRSGSTASSCSSAGAESIREVIAFPKNNRGVDLMTHSPVEVDFKQLRELYIQSTARKT